MTKKITIQKIAGYIDHTNLKPNAIENDIKKLCIEAKKYDFHSVCVSPVYIELASESLKDTNIKICSVVGFPAGHHRTEVKVCEAEKALDAGATELDMVIQIGYLIDSNLKAVINDIESVARICHHRSALIKVIIETAYLSRKEKINATNLILKSGADYIKTSTGFADSGATVGDIKLFKQILKGTHVKIKAAGGIRTYTRAVEMIRAGADRIGTSSGVSIVQEENRIKLY